VQKKLLTAAILSTICGATAAQSNVTVYGLIDTGIEYLNNAGATGGSVTRMSSGAMNTSRIGFRGTEDLGGGLKAIFQLENGFKLDNGAFDGDAGQLFNRQSNVGLEGGFGRIVAGRSFSTTYDFILPFDPMGYSAQYSWVTSAGATGGRKDGMPTGVSNLVKYQGDFGGFKLGAMYGFGEVAGSVNDSSKYGLGLGYGNGPFSLATTYDRVNGTAAVPGGSFDKTTTVHLAGGYQVMESLKFNLGYRYFKKSLASQRFLLGRGNVQVHTGIEPDRHDLLSESEKSGYRRRSDHVFAAFEIRFVQAHRSVRQRRLRQGKEQSAGRPVA
jgi:predicted porin